MSIQTTPSLCPTPCIFGCVKGSFLQRLRLLAGLWAGLLEGEQGDLVCSPEPQWPGVRDSRAGVWLEKKSTTPSAFFPFLFT